MKNSDQNKLFGNQIKYSNKNKYTKQSWNCLFFNVNKYAKQSKKQSHPFRHQ